MAIVYLLIGTNLGDRLNNLEVCKGQLLKFHIKVNRESNIYETAAWGITNQPSFYNQAIEVETEYTPEDLLIHLKEIEKSMGRLNAGRWQQRLIDIDILYYGSIVLDREDLKIPHAQIANRRFTLVPLNDIAEDYIHPTTALTNKELLENCKDSLAVHLVKLV